MIADTTAPRPATPLFGYSEDDPLYDLQEASALRNPDGTRRFGAQSTIRRYIVEGYIPHELVAGSRKYLVRLSSLEAFERSRGAGPEAAFAGLEIAANRILASVGPLSDEQAERIAARLKGVR